MKRRSNIKTMIVTLLALLFFIQAAEAQENALGDLGQIVITASRMAQHNYKIASNVSVIDSHTMRESAARTVDDLLDEEMGVMVYDSGTAKTATVDIRGFGDTANRNVLILVNDRKVNSIDVSGPDLLQIPLGAVDQIEIIRGGGSVLYGDNAVGGVVNIITKEGEGPLSGKIGLNGGSYNTFGQELELSGETKGVSYYHYFRHNDTGGYRCNSDMLTKDFMTRLGYTLTDKLKVSLNTSWHEDDYGLPGGLNDTELVDLGRRGSADEEDFASTKDRFVQLTLDVSPWPENAQWGRFVIDSSYRNRDTYAMFTAWDFGTKRMIDTLGITGKYIFDQKLLGRNFNMVAGVDYYDTDNDIWGSGSNSDDITITKRELGFYTFAEAETLDDLYINGGVRKQRANYIFEQRSGTPNNEKQKAEEWVGMLGSRYDYGKGSNFFWNVQQTFRFLASDEWYSTWSGLNTGLKQQTGIQYEFGVKHNFDDTATVSVTPYWMSLRNEIFFDPTAGFFGENNNYGKTRRIGVEMGNTLRLNKFIKWDSLSKLEFWTNYTYQVPEFVSGAKGGKRIPLAPAYQANWGINTELWEKYLVSFSAQYMGSRYAINDILNETPKLKPYIVCDLKFSYTLENWEIFLEANNIFNEKYFSYATKAVGSSTKDYFPAPERNFRVGMNIKF